MKKSRCLNICVWRLAFVSADNTHSAFVWQLFTSWYVSKYLSGEGGWRSLKTFSVKGFRILDKFLHDGFNHMYIKLVSLELLLHGHMPNVDMLFNIRQSSDKRHLTIASGQ